MYATYEFYTDTYFGNNIPSADFNKWERKAKAKLDYLTYNRITEEMFNDEALGDKIRLATCSVMDVLYNIDKAEKFMGTSDSGEGKIIKSRSSGSESITYDTGNDVFAKAAGNTGEINRMCLSSVTEYLFDTGLLYRGC